MSLLRNCASTWYTFILQVAIQFALQFVLYFVFLKVYDVTMNCKMSIITPMGLY